MFVNLTHPRHIIYNLEDLVDKYVYNMIKNKPIIFKMSLNRSIYSNLFVINLNFFLT